ncbi:hypothetical protein SAMN06297422_101115 [Lachnospiraceae bacterium]|nr:hypothetical protein SAMN06297422_101115 [Lachnospiraceae bacterium]
MKNSKKNVITGKMMVKAFMIVALVATVVLMGLGIYTADSQLIGQVSMFAAFEAIMWSYMGLEKKNAEKKSEKSEVVA